MEFIARLEELREPEDRVVEIRLVGPQGEERRFKLRLTPRYPPSLAPPAAGMPHAVFTMAADRFSQLLGEEGSDGWRRAWEGGEIVVRGDQKLVERIVSELTSPGPSPSG